MFTCGRYPLNLERNVIGGCGDRIFRVSEQMIRVSDMLGGGSVAFTLVSDLIIRGSDLLVVVNDVRRRISDRIAGERDIIFSVRTVLPFMTKQLARSSLHVASGHATVGTARSQLVSCAPER